MLGFVVIRSRLDSWVASFRRFRSAKRGQVSVIVATSIVSIAVGAGSSVDTAIIMTEGMRLQGAVDGAALYAVREIGVRAVPTSSVEGLAENFAEASFRPRFGAEVTAARPVGDSTTATVISRSPAKVEVVANRRVNLFFGGLHDRPTTIVTRKSTAIEAMKTPITLLLLEKTAAAAWKASGNSSVVALDGAAIVNSNSNAALQGSGTADLITTGTLVVGPVAPAPNWSPAPSFGASPVRDPYEGTLPWPSGQPCTASSGTIKNATGTLGPGHYCGGLDLQTHANVTLSPGVYQISGPLLVSSNSKLNAPSGVTLVLTGPNAYVQFQAGSDVTLKAPTTGVWKDIAIAVQPQNVEKTSTLIGGAELNMDGVMYFPTQKVLVTGGGATSVVQGSRILIAKRLETAGNGRIYLKGDADVANVYLGARLVK